jgi:hypothetical protein
MVELVERLKEGLLILIEAPSWNYVTVLEVLTDETEWVVAIQFAQVGCRPIVVGLNLQNPLLNHQKFKYID